MPSSNDDGQGTLFDLEASEAAKAEGIARVERGSDPDWAERAFDAGVHLCHTQEEFTPDDMWLLVEKPPEPRALGPVMLRLVKGGYCEWTGRFARSLIPVHHRTPIRIYRSLIR